jgi:voltage-gated sodium channel
MSRESATGFEWFRCRARELIHRGHHFDALMGVIIVTNSLVIAVETQLKMEGALPDYLKWIESAFLVCFILELVLRWLADGQGNLKEAWFWFDSTLVALGVLSSWILDPLSSVTNLEEVPVLSQVLTLRVLRLMRLVRALRLMEAFQELWRLCVGLSKSLRTMLSVCLLVVVVVFVFACMGVETITTSEILAQNEETAEIIRTYFSSLPMAIITLMQFANADSVAAIYLPICREDPTFVIYFLVLWLVVTVALMNLVTAIIVENALSNGREEGEEKQRYLRKVVKRIIPEIEEVFNKLDSDGSQALTIEEIEAAAFKGKLTLPNDIKEFVEPTKLLEMFEFLDNDQSGEITKDEFVDGVCSLVVSAVPIETTQILQLTRQTHRAVMDALQAVRQPAGVTPPPPPSPLPSPPAPPDQTSGVALPMGRGSCTS